MTLEWRAREGITLGKRGVAYLRRLGLFLTADVTVNRGAFRDGWKDTRLLKGVRDRRNGSGAAAAHPFAFICSAMIVC